MYHKKEEGWRVKDNARVPTSFVSLSATNNTGFEQMDHPPQSPDLVPSDFYLYLKLRESFRESRFYRDDEVMTAVKNSSGG